MNNEHWVMTIGQARHRQQCYRVLLCVDNLSFYMMFIENIAFLVRLIPR